MVFLFFCVFSLHVINTFSPAYFLLINEHISYTLCLKKRTNVSWSSHQLGWGRKSWNKCPSATDLNNDLFLCLYWFAVQFLVISRNSLDGTLVSQAFSVHSRMNHFAIVTPCGLILSKCDGLAEKEKQRYWHWRNTSAQKARTPRTWKLYWLCRSSDWEMELWGVEAQEGVKSL